MGMNSNQLAMVRALAENRMLKNMQCAAVQRTQADMIKFAAQIVIRKAVQENG